MGCCAFGTCYYDESAVDKLNLISTFLFLHYSVNDLSAILNESTSFESIHSILKKQEEELRLNRKRIDEWLYILEHVDNYSTEDLSSWDGVARTIHQIMYEKQMVDAHSTGLGRFIHNFWRSYGCPIDKWLQWRFEPVTFDSSPMHMAEINASVLDYWRYNIKRLPSGQLDLYYDSSVRVGSEVLSREDIKTKWIDMKALQDIPNETYDLIFNDHLHFYGENLEKGLSEMFRILKKGGKLFVTAVDTEHNATVRKWTHYIDPSLGFTTKWHNDHFSSERLIKLFREDGFSIVDYPRFDNIKVTDELDLLDHIKTRCNILESNEPVQFRFENVKKEIHSIFKKQGYIEMESRYHILKVVK